MSENAGCPYTVTVMFKDPPAHLVAHAWSILRRVCKGKELFPDKVNEWMMDVLRTYPGQEQQNVQEEEEPAPGSARAEPRRKRTEKEEEDEEEEKPVAHLGEFIVSKQECEALGHDKVEQCVEVDWDEGNNEFVATNAVEKEIQEEPELVRWRSVKGHAHARGSRTQRRWISRCSCQALPANRPFTSSLRRHIAAL